MWPIYKKDGTYNDRYNCLHNQIPFCFEDCQQIFHAVTQKETEVNIGRTGCQAFCEIARFFMLQATKRPVSLRQQQDLPPIYLLEKVKDTFPGLQKEAKRLYVQFLEKWNNEESPVASQQLLQEKKESSSGQSSEGQQEKSAVGKRKERLTLTGMQTRSRKRQSQT